MLVRLAALIVIVAAMWVGVARPAVGAQCAMCRSSVANSERAAEAAGTLNAAILVLLIPTLAIIGGIAGLVLRHRHAPGAEARGVAGVGGREPWQVMDGQEETFPARPGESGRSESPSGASKPE